MGFLWSTLIKHVMDHWSYIFIDICLKAYLLVSWTLWNWSWSWYSATGFEYNGHELQMVYTTSICSPSIVVMLLKSPAPLSCFVTIKYEKCLIFGTFLEFGCNCASIVAFTWKGNVQEIDIHLQLKIIKLIFVYYVLRSTFSDRRVEMLWLFPFSSFWVFRFQTV